MKDNSNLWLGIRKSLKLYEQMLKGVCIQYQLTGIEADVISFLQHNPGKDTAMDMVELRLLSKGSISKAVEGLIQKSILRRHQDVEDRRVIHLELLPCLLYTSALFTPGGAATFPFLQNIFGDSFQAGGNAAQNANAQKSAEKKQKAEKRPKRKHLDTYCYNLTQKAKDGKLDAIIGRDKEIGRVVQILSRRTKKNTCLIGEPGVGKTAIAEGLALRIASGNVPARLRTKAVSYTHLQDAVQRLREIRSLLKNQAPQKEF